MTRKELWEATPFDAGCDQQATVGAEVLWPADEVEPYTLVFSHVVYSSRLRHGQLARA